MQCFMAKNTTRTATFYSKIEFMMNLYCVISGGAFTVKLKSSGLLLCHPAKLPVWDTGKRDIQFHNVR